MSTRKKSTAAPAAAAGSKPETGVYSNIGKAIHSGVKDAAYEAVKDNVGNELGQRVRDTILGGMNVGRDRSGSGSGSGNTVRDVFEFKRMLQEQKMMDTMLKSLNDDTGSGGGGADVVKNVLAMAMANPEIMKALGPGGITALVQNSGNATDHTMRGLTDLTSRLFPGGVGNTNTDSGTLTEIVKLLLTKFIDGKSGGGGNGGEDAAVAEMRRQNEELRRRLEENERRNELDRVRNELKAEVETMKRGFSELADTLKRGNGGDKQGDMVRDLFGRFFDSQSKMLEMQSKSRDDYAKMREDVTRQEIAVLKSQIFKEGRAPGLAEAAAEVKEAMDLFGGLGNKSDRSAELGHEYNMQKLLFESEKYKADKIVDTVERVMEKLGDGVIEKVVPGIVRGMTEDTGADRSPVTSTAIQRSGRPMPGDITEKDLDNVLERIDTSFNEEAPSGGDIGMDTGEAGEEDTGEFGGEFDDTTMDTEVP